MHVEHKLSDGEERDAAGDEDRAREAPRADAFAQDERRTRGGNDHARLTDGGDRRRRGEVERSEDESVGDERGQSSDDGGRPASAMLSAASSTGSGGTSRSVR